MSNIITISRRSRTKHFFQLEPLKKEIVMNITQLLLKSLDGLPAEQAVYNLGGALREAGISVDIQIANEQYVRSSAGDLRQKLEAILAPPVEVVQPVQPVADAVAVAAMPVAEAVSDGDDILTFPEGN
jgi:hypothetical protein